MRLILAVVPLLAWAGPALGWECTATQNGASLVWKSRCVPFFIQDTSELLTANEGAVVAALDEYTRHACSDMELKFLGRSGDRGVNLISTAENADELPDRNLISLTVTSFSIETGELLDVDVILNEANYSFAVLERTASCVTYDLETVLVSELGAALGFANETAVAPCSIEDRDLSADAIDGLCTVYPTDMATNPCVPGPGSASGLSPNACSELTAPEIPEIGDDGCGCQTTARSSGFGGVLLFVCAVLGSTRVRRHHGRGRWARELRAFSSRYEEKSARR